MEIKEEHRRLLKTLGLKDRDFELFDGKFVRYEFDEKRGVRIYDPYYTTSYEEYIDSDGWSAWSEEGDTFMSSLLGTSQDMEPQSRTGDVREDQKKITEALQKKFGKKTEADSK
jgi:hypothetical protein